MNILTVWSIIGLFYYAVAYENHDGKIQRTHNERHHHKKRAHYRLYPAEALEAQPVSVNVNKSLSNNEGLNLVYDTEAKQLGFGNVTAKVAAVSVIQGEATVIFLVDTKSGTVARFESADDVTVTQNEELKGELLPTLKKIIADSESANKTDKPVQSSSEEALSLWSDVYLHLVHKKANSDKIHRNLKLPINLFRKLNRLFSGSLKGLLKGRSALPLKQSLNRFLTITMGLHTIFSKATGGLKEILSKNVTFELDSLYNGKNGAEVFVYILRKTSEKFNLATLWARMLNNIEEILKVIQQLGGGESKNGVDETFAITSRIWSALTLRLSVTSLVTYLFEATSEESWSKAGNADLSQVWKDLKNIIDDQSKKYDNSRLLTPFVVFATNFTANGLVYNDVNVSSLVEKWRKRDYFGTLQVITEITLKFGNPEKYTQVIFNGLTAFLNSTSDPAALQRLIPGISLNDFSNQSNSLLETMCKGYNVDELLKNNGNANEILGKIPVFSEFSKKINNSYGFPFNFTKALNGLNFMDYFNKFIVSPTNLSFQGVSNFWQGSANIIKQTIFEPFKNILPGVGNISNILPIPSLPPNLGPKLDKDDTTSTPSPCEDDTGSKCKTKNDCKEEDCNDKKPARKENELPIENIALTETEPTKSTTTGQTTSKSVSPKDCGDDCNKSVEIKADKEGRISLENKHNHKAKHHGARVHHKTDTSKVEHHGNERAHHHQKHNHVAHDKKNNQHHGHENKSH